MKAIILLTCFLSLNIAQAQVYVNNVDLNKSAKTFELHMAKKPFTTKDSYYVDYGQPGFKEGYYDGKAQAISDSSKVKFEKGEYIRLLNYLESQGWTKDSQRESYLGDLPINIVLFRRKES